MGEGGFVYLHVNDCDDNASRRGAYYGRVSNRTVCVTGLINIIPAIPYSYMHTIAVIYSYNHVTPLSIWRGYVV